jgi:O-antigen/teichoic acid export membrane protein
MSLYTTLRNCLARILRKSEKYTGTDMVYLTKNIGWISLGNGISSLASLALLYVFGNFISQNDYGTYQYVLSIIGILSISTMPGMNTALTTAIAQNHEGTLKEGLKTRIRWGLLACIASIGIASYYFINDNLILAMSFLGVSIFLPFMDSFSVFISYIEGKKQFKKSAKYAIIISTLRVVSLVGCILLTKNIVLIILVYIISTTILRGAVLFFILKKNKLNTTVDHEAITYGKHLSFMRAFANGIVSLDNILLFHYLGAAQLAIYSFAKVPVTKIIGAVTPITSLAYPKFSETPKNVLKKTLPKKLFLLMLLMVVITAAYLLLAPFLFSIVLPNYMDSVFYSQLFALALLFIPQKFIVSVLTAHKQQKALYILNTVNPVVRVLLLILLLPLFGITGVIISFLISLVINGIMAFYFFLRMKEV